MLTIEQQNIIASTNNVKITLSEIDKNIVMGMIETKTNNFAVFVLDLNNAERTIRINTQSEDFIDTVPDVNDPDNLERIIRLAIKLLEQI